MHALELTHDTALSVPAFWPGIRGTATRFQLLACAAVAATPNSKTVAIAGRLLEHRIVVARGGSRIELRKTRAQGDALQAVHRQLAILGEERVAGREHAGGDLGREAAKLHAEILEPGHRADEEGEGVDAPGLERDQGGGIGHVAFRVDSLDEVRSVYEKVRGLPFTKPEPVSHGNTWSVYFRDPENNRIEVFTQTPWHATQPCRFDVNYDQDDAALKDATRTDASKLAGFTSNEAWQEEFNRHFEPAE